MIDWNSGNPEHGFDVWTTLDDHGREAGRYWKPCYASRDSYIVMLVRLDIFELQSSRPVYLTTEKKEAVTRVLVLVTQLDSEVARSTSPTKKAIGYLGVLDEDTAELASSYGDIADGAVGLSEDDVVGDTKTVAVTNGASYVQVQVAGARGAFPCALRDDGSVEIMVEGTFHICLGEAKHSRPSPPSNTHMEPLPDCAHGENGLPEVEPIPVVETGDQKLPVDLVSERPHVTTQPDNSYGEIADGAVGLSEATSPIVWKFKCVREKRLEKQARIDTIGSWGVFNENMTKLAKSYGEITANGNAYLSTLSPDSPHGENGLPAWYTEGIHICKFTYQYILVDVLFSHLYRNYQ